MPRVPIRLKTIQKELFDYYLSGNHAFVACDDKKRATIWVKELEDRILDNVSITLDCTELSTSADFSQALTDHTNSLLKDLGEKPFVCTQYPGTCLQVLNDLLTRVHSQGYLLLLNIDDVISGQTNFEIEASLREVMQFRSDVAVLIAGSKSTIVAMGQSDRPFYLSFRIFWFD